VLATGDVVVAPVPFGFGSYPGEWLAVLDKILAMDTAAIIPGHGPVMRDTKYIATLQRILTSLRAQAQDAVKQNLSLEDAQKKMDFTAFRAELAGDDPLLWRAFVAFFLDSAIPRAYAEAKGEVLVE
jgi:glyoxylase-like metal-dependent hydrolase (beta-lactamase superfamily II)